MSEIHESLQEYYGKTIHSKNDLKTKACMCTPGAHSKEVRAVMPLIADEIITRFYGCGSPIPPLLEGKTILDLGCGTGRDVYIVAKLAGESGLAIGVDMTDEQLAVARKFEEEQRIRFGFTKSNVVFHKGFIEDLAALGIGDETVDVVISNCVINLSPHKEAVFREIYRVLKPGGELFFSDVFADRRIPESISLDPLLRGECLGGAIYTEDFRRMMQKTGWADFRYMNVRSLSPDNEDVEKKVGFVQFSERTIRAFKIDGLEDICEDYGQVAYYNGSIPGYPHYFDLDDHHRFYTGKPMLICGNTAAMLEKTRFVKDFRVVGDRTVHYGAFDCSGGSCPQEEPVAEGSCC
jgi:SAM-dependent methyltransferase